MGVVRDLAQACLAVVPRVARLVLLAMVGSRKVEKVSLQKPPKGGDGMLLSGMLLCVVETLLGGWER